MGMLYWGASVETWVQPPFSLLLPVGFWVPLAPLPSCLGHGLPSPYHGPEVVSMYVSEHLCVCVRDGRQAAFELPYL